MPKAPKSLTPLEALIMDAIWDLAPVTVRQIQEHFQATRPMAYNTVLTMMRILRDKGFLKSERQGRIDVYQPLFSREQIGRRSVGEVLDLFFAGSARSLVSQLLDSEKISREELAQLRREIDRRLREQS